MLARPEKKLTEKYSTDELIVLGLVLTIFISIYTTVAGLVFTLFYLIRQNRVKKILESVSGANYLLAFILLTLFVSAMHENLWGALIAVAFGAILLIGLFVRTVMTRRLFEKIISVSCKASLFSFLVIGAQVLANLSDIGQFRAGSTFMNANYYAASTEIIVLFCVYKLLDPAAQRKERYAAVMLVNFAGLYLSDCRTAIAALGVALLALLFVSRRYKAFGAAVAVLVLYAVAIKILPELFPRTDAIGEDLAVRQSIWRTAIQGILAHPVFGLGGGSYMQISSQLGGPAVKHAHNLILDTLLNFGLAGTALLGLFLRDNIKAVRKMAGSVLDHKRFTLIVAILLSVLIHGLTDITFFSVQTGLLLALVLSFAGISSEPQPARAYRIRKPAWIADKPARAKAILHARLDLPQNHYARLENAHLMSGNDMGYRR